MEAFKSQFLIVALATFLAVMRADSSVIRRESVLFRVCFFAVARIAYYRDLIVDNRLVSRGFRVIALAIVALCLINPAFARHTGGSTGSGRGFKQSRTKKTSIRAVRTGHPANPFKFSEKKAKNYKYRKPF